MPAESLGNNNTNENNPWIHFNRDPVQQSSEDVWNINDNKTAEQMRPAYQTVPESPSAEHGWRQYEDNSEAQNRTAYQTVPESPSAEHGWKQYENNSIEQSRPTDLSIFEPAIMSSETAYNDMSEAQQNANLKQLQQEREEAKDTVESIKQRDDDMLKKVESIAFNDNLRSEFLQSYHADAIGKINQFQNDFSEQASQEVNKYVGDFCAVILTMDNLNRDGGQRLLDSASNGYEIAGTNGTLDELNRFMQNRRKNGCNTEIPVPINYSDENPHPKLDAVIVMTWLEKRLDDKNLDRKESDNALREQVTTKLTGKNAYQRYQERMAARQNAKNQ